MQATKFKTEKGKLIVFDGIDSCGKSTLAREVAKQRAIENKDVLVTREPTSSFPEIKKRIQIMGEDEDGMLLTALSADRKFHLANVIAPAWTAGIEIMCDGYKYSTVAHQSARGTDRNEAIDKCRGTPHPNIAFIINVPVEVALERRKKEYPPEYPLFLEEVRKNYLEMLEIFSDEVIVILNGTLPIEKLVSIVNREINALSPGTYDNNYRVTTALDYLGSTHLPPT